MDNWSCLFGYLFLWNQFSLEQVSEKVYGDDKGGNINELAPK